MRIVKVEPGKPAEICEIDGSLESMQEIVGGYIECLYPWKSKVTLICNEEGKIRGLQPNREITYGFGAKDIIFGTFFFCRSEGEELVSLTEGEAEYFQKAFSGRMLITYNEETGKWEVAVRSV